MRGSWARLGGPGAGRAGGRRVRRLARGESGAVPYGSGITRVRSGCTCWRSRPYSQSRSSSRPGDMSAKVPGVSGATSSSSAWLQRRSRGHRTYWQRSFPVPSPASRPKGFQGVSSHRGCCSARAGLVSHLCRAKCTHQETQRSDLPGYDAGVAGFCSAAGGSRRLGRVALESGSPCGCLCCWPGC